MDLTVGECRKCLDASVTATVRFESVSEFARYPPLEQLLAEGLKRDLRVDGRSRNATYLGWLSR